MADAASAGQLSAFVREYFGQVDPEDLAERQAADLYGAAMSHWSYARRREPGQAKVRVFNPSIAEHGWQSTHTIIEIVNDDMPFLVDSVTMEVNRHGLTLHLIIHPVMCVVRDAAGHYLGLGGEAGPDGERGQRRYESMIHVEVDRRTDAVDLDALRDGLERVLADVRVAVADWPAMQQRVVEIAKGIEGEKPPPGFTSDATATGTPAAMRSRAGANRPSFR